VSYCHQKASLGSFFEAVEKFHRNLSGAVHDVLRANSPSISHVALDVDVCPLFFYTGLPLSIWRLAARAVYNKSLLPDAVFALYYGPNSIFHCFCKRLRGLRARVSLYFHFETGRNP
jgi:hypothetical protein